MVESFKEFLEKSMLSGKDLGVSYATDKPCLIGKTELGNWAWESISKNLDIEKVYFEKNKGRLYYWRLMEKTHFVSFFDFCENRVFKEWKQSHWEIAVACLGEAELEKRLKELK